MAKLQNASNLNFDINDLQKLSVHLKTLDKLKEGRRQSNMKLELRTDTSTGQPCMRFDLEAEDSDVPNKPGITFIIDAHGLYCPHPKDSKVIALIEYTRRTPKGDSFIAERSEGERFLNSIELTMINR